jgi:hypothetical protein
MKWDHQFIAKHDSCCALAGTADTAIRCAERRVNDQKGKILMIDYNCSVRPINDHDGRRYAMGISCSRDPEVVVAFQNAALRDNWVLMLCTNEPDSLGRYATAGKHVVSASL